MRIVGIDPGKTGALAHVDLDDMRVLDLVDMPVVIGKAGKDEPDPRQIYDLLRAMRPDLIVIEHVQPMGKMGAASLFVFAASFGELLAAAKLSCGKDRRVTLVRPASWKAAMGLSSGKADSLSMARNLFPDTADMLTRVTRDDGRAEALLLTEYHRRFVAPLESVEVF